MARIDDLINSALCSLPPKPPDSAKAPQKKRYSELLSQKVAAAVAEEFRHRGLKEARPCGPGVLGGSGAERRMAGGLGAKKVDVTWATEEAGLLLAISIKSINFRDANGNFQKNLTNRRGDMLIEAVTLHRRFPYAVLGAFFFFDNGAATDNVKNGKVTRRPTVINAHARLKLFTGRNDPSGRDEQFEKFYILLVEATPTKSTAVVYEVGNPGTAVPLEAVFENLLKIAAERNPDFYEYEDGRLLKLS